MADSVSPWWWLPESAPGCRCAWPIQSLSEPTVAPDTASLRVIAPLWAVSFDSSAAGTCRRGRCACPGMAATVPRSGGRDVRTGLRVLLTDVAEDVRASLERDRTRGEDAHLVVVDVVRGDQDVHRGERVQVDPGGGRIAGLGAGHVVRAQVVADDPVAGDVGGGIGHDDLDAGVIVARCRVPHQPVVPQHAATLADHHDGDASGEEVMAAVDFVFLHDVADDSEGRV